MAEEATTIIAPPADSPELVTDELVITDEDLEDSDLPAGDEESPAADNSPADTVTEIPPDKATESTEGTEDTEGTEKAPVADAGPRLVLGKYRPEVPELTKALENLEGLIGRQAAQIAELKKKAETPSEAVELLQLVKTDPDKALDKMDKIRAGAVERAETVQQQFLADPDGFIDQKLSQRLETIEARQTAHHEYRTKLRQVYTPEGFDAMADMRANIKAAIDNQKIGEEELLHLAALGRAVRDGKLKPSADAPGSGLPVGPGGGGSGQPHNRSGKTTVEQEDDEFFASGFDVIGGGR